MEIRRLGSPLFPEFRDLLAEVEMKSEKKYFHPHPLTDAEAKRLCEYEGDDEYYLMIDGDLALAYGMLRGWDEGYDIPSLGIYVREGYRIFGLGKLLMEFLHLAAKLRGATKIRIKVHKENQIARKLFLKIGYEFSEEEKEFSTGYCSI